MGQCDQCRFYEGSRHLGSCRRYAPQPQPVDRMYNVASTAWPTVYHNDWCGEFKPKDITVSTTPETNDER